MQVFSVGGSVRDELLGLPVKDRDWVVVGASPEEMTALGYKPVGRDFPVFLHPDTREEYALARTERKSAPGYRGFTVHAAPDVTLEQDLERRDLTINAMARDQQGALIDPYGGERDLKAGVLRHVSPAFAEDPVRILRVARFAARYGFRVAAETRELMRSMVEEGEADALVAERVWQELARGLMERDPWRMIVVLCDSRLLPRWLPEFGLRIDGEDEQARPADEASAIVAAALAHAAREAYSLAVRFALLLGPARARRDPAAAEAVCERLRVPADCRDLAALAQKRLQAVPRAPSLAAHELVGLLEASDAFRRPQRLEELVRVAESESLAAGQAPERSYRPRQALRAALAAAQSVDAAQIAAGGGDIGARLREARIARVRTLLAGGGA